MEAVTPQGKALHFSNQTRSILKEETIRKIVAKPRLVHRRAREEIALLLAEELNAKNRVDKKTLMPQIGAFYLVLEALETSDLWREAEKIASRGETPTILVLDAIVPAILDAVEDPENLERKAQDDEKTALSAFASLMAGTWAYWDKRSWDQLPLEAGLVERLDHFLDSDEAGVLYGLLKRTVIKRSEKRIKEIRRTMNLLDMLSRLLPSEYSGHMEDLYRLYLKDIEALARVLKRSQELKQILEFMGRLETETSNRRDRVVHFYSNESHSLHQSRDVHRVLPVELVKLRDPTLRRLFYARLLEGNLLTYELKKPDRQPQRRGPVVALVDASGSMCGDSEDLAKALILAITRRMAKEKRAVKVILFSTRDKMHKIDLSFRANLLNEFLDFLSYIFEGGTDFNSALKAGLEELQKEEWRGADLLFISDGLSTISDEAAQEWSSYRSRTKSRIFTLVVGNDNAGGLERISDFTNVMKSPKDWRREASPANVLSKIKLGY